MARTVLTYGGLDLNDGVSWFLLPGFDPGAPVLTYDELRGWGSPTAPVVQVNVSEANLIEMTVPLRVQGTSEADLAAEVAALNAKIAAGAQTLIHGPVGATAAYSCVRSPRVSYARDAAAKVAYTAFLTFTPLRLP